MEAGCELRRRCGGSDRRCISSHKRLIATGAVDCMWGWGWRLIARRRSVAHLGRECGGVVQVRSTGRGSRASAAVAGVRAKRALQWEDHLYRPGPVLLLCSRFFACLYFASLRVLFYRESLLACLAFAALAMLPCVCVNASACLGYGCVGSCPPLRSYRCVACERLI